MDSVREDRSRVRLQIEDHGGGVLQEIRDRIFDPFFSTKPREHGTGLGLSISYGIVVEHGGDLHLEVDAGKRSRFIVDLPVDGPVAGKGRRNPLSGA